MRRSRLLLVAASCALISACSYKPGFINEYKIDIQQGNVLTQEMVSQLKPGQTRDQVRFLLGTPLVVDIFHQQRWDYVYRYQNGQTGAVESRKFTVYFDREDRLASVTATRAAELLPSIHGHDWVLKNECNTYWRRRGWRPHGPDVDRGYAQE